MARILAVDDSEQNLMMIELYLRGGEFEVVCAQSGRQALELCSKQAFDLILLDVVMPGVDGFEVCRRLKANARTAFVPVIFLTAHMGDESDKLQAYEMGAVDYIRKPVQREELVARIKVMLRLEDARSRLERENAGLAASLQDAQRALAEVGRRAAALESVRALTDTAAGGGVLLLDGQHRVLAADAFTRQCLGELVVGSALMAAGHAAARLQRLLDDGATQAELALVIGGEPRTVSAHVHELAGGDQIIVVLRDITALLGLREQIGEREVAPLPAQPARVPGYAMTGFVGGSAKIAELAGLVERLRQNRSTVLIVGESGTGKDLIARALHFDGANRHSPFIPIHCGAISPDLIESELFGYEKGAFTGAQQSREGLFSAADGGTIFLDEIAETSMDVQVKLLRVLQMGEIRPVGANQPRLVDVRILAATNRDLLQMVRDGRFREDLYFRLEVVTLPVPPLRERVEDIPVLVAHFIQRANRRHRRDAHPVGGIAQAAIARLLAYPWPGNVRELENVIDRAFALGVGDLVQEEDLPAHVIHGQSVLGTTVAGDPGRRVVAAAAAPPVLDLRTLREQAEREAILQALAGASGDKQLAARALGMSRSTFYRRWKELGL